MVGRIAEIEGWTVAGDSCDEVRRPVADGSRSHLPVDRGEDFDEQRFAEVTVEHYVHAPA